MRTLIVVDMQNDFIDGVLESDAARAVVPRVVEKIKSFDGCVLATLDTHYSNYFNTREGKILPAHCEFDTDGWELTPLIKREVITRICKVSFASVELVDYLKKYFDVREEHYIELVGVATDICVISNALLLKAHFPEWEIAVDPLCCAGSSVEAHEAALVVLKSCQITITGANVGAQI